MISRRAMLLGLGSIAVARPSWAATQFPSVMTYRNPGCGCCEKWVSLMQQAGFHVMMVDDENLAERRTQAGVPEQLAGCHTSMIGNYVIEGHVPPDDVILFLAENPKALGLAVAGMPKESAGMESGGAADPYQVIQFNGDGTQKIFAKYG